MSDTAPSPNPASSPPSFSRKNPFLAELTKHEPLTQPGSLKDTRHFVLNLAGSGLTYTPGDSLGAFARNPPPLVNEVITLLGFDADSVVKDGKGQSTTLRQTLLEDHTLNRANRKIM